MESNLFSYDGPLPDSHVGRIQERAEFYHIDVYKRQAEAFVDPEKDVNTAEEALAGAMDIIAEMIADDPAMTAAVRNLTDVYKRQVYHHRRRKQRGGFKA